MLQENHFSGECDVEIDESSDLLCEEDRQKGTEYDIIPNTEESALDKGVQLLGLQSPLTNRKIEEAPKTDNGKKNVLNSETSNEIEGQQIRQESGRSVVVATAAAESSPVTTSRCKCQFFLFIQTKNNGFFCQAKYQFNLTKQRSFLLKTNDAFGKISTFQSNTNSNIQLHTFFYKMRLCEHYRCKHYRSMLFGFLFHNPIIIISYSSFPHNEEKPGASLQLSAVSGASINCNLNFSVYFFENFTSQINLLIIN